MVVFFLFDGAYNVSVLKKSMFGKRNHSLSLVFERPNIEMCSTLENLWREMANTSDMLASIETKPVAQDQKHSNQRNGLESLSTVFETTLAVEDIEAYAPFMQSSIKHTLFVSLYNLIE